SSPSTSPPLPENLQKRSWQTPGPRFPYALSSVHGGICKWLKHADCKSVRVTVRWFESGSHHHFLKAPLGGAFRYTEYGSGSERPWRGMARTPQRAAAVGLELRSRWSNRRVKQFRSARTPAERPSYRGVGIGTTFKWLPIKDVGWP